MKNDRYKKLGKNTLLMVGGNFASKILTFILLPLYTACLTTSEYGIADLMTTTINLCIPFLTLTISESVLRMTLDKNSDKKQIFTITVSVIGIGFIVLIVSMPLWKNIVPFKEYIILFLLYYLVMVLSNIAQQFAKGLEHVDVFVVSGILTTFATCIWNVLLLVVVQLGITGYLLAYILGYATSFIYIFIKEKLWNYWIPIHQINLQILHEILIYCVPLIPNSISWWISDSSDRYILNYFWGAAITGVYSIAYKIPSVISILSTILTSAWQISAIEDFGSEESKVFFSEIYQKYTSIYIIASSVIILFIKLISRILFTGEFYEAWKYAAILLIAVVFQALNGFLGIIYAASKRTKTIFLTTIVGAGSNIILNVLLIPDFGAFGAAIATMISYIVVWLMRLIDSRKIMPIQIDFKKDMISYGIIGIQCCVSYAEHRLGFAICMGMCLVIIFINRKVILEIFKIFMQGGKNNVRI